MASKRVDAYTMLMETVRQDVLPQNVHTHSVMTDYEAAMRQAVRQVFRATLLKGCWFHYARAVYMKCELLTKLSV